MKILVSSCLIGKKCAYDGKDRFSTRVKDLSERAGYIDVCPEAEGGLGCPRERNEIAGGNGNDVLSGAGRVLSENGTDNTAAFVRGAEAVLKKARESGVQAAILKSKSPSCGKYKLHSGKFDGALIDGPGVTAALLMRHGIRVFTEDEVEDAFLSDG
jgi:uncharacterized protein YbbK (DUF523 family)